NKVDLVEDPARLSFLQAKYPEAVTISARTGTGIEALELKFMEYLSRHVTRRHYKIPQHRGDLVSLLHAEAKVLNTAYEGNDVLVEALVSSEMDGRLRGMEGVAILERES
ncbi:MAG: hypothetical protein ABGZ37_05530, partial [Akkermansiaceae bacterium]